MPQLLLALLVWAGHPAAVAADTGFTVVHVDPAAQDLQLFWGDEHGTPFRRFDKLATWLQGQGRQLAFGMNAGMYQADGSAVGLLVVKGKQLSPLNLSEGPGNFFLKPNGVFFVSPSGAQVVDAVAYPALANGAVFATQSGPLLLRNGVVHPAFNPASASRLIRNGVGMSGKTIVFVISEKPVNFHEFAVFFRDVLKCKDALYLDGVVSSLHSAELKRSDRKAGLGPLFGVVR